MRFLARIFVAAVFATSGLFVVSAAHAQSTAASARTFTRLTGIVTDSLGNPIADAQVEIAGRLPYINTIYCRTAADGSFSTDSLVVGDSYTIAAARLGFRATALAPFTVEAPAAHVRLVLARRTVIVVKAKEPATAPVAAERAASDVSAVTWRVR